MRAFAVILIVLLVAAATWWWSASTTAPVVPTVAPAPAPKVEPPRSDEAAGEPVRAPAPAPETTGVGTATPGCPGPGWRRFQQHVAQSLRELVASR
jgi:hypothetical protein